MRRTTVCVVTALVVASSSSSSARGGGRVGAGGRAAGGFSGRGPAASGYLGQRVPGAQGAGFSSHGPAAGGSFAGRAEIAGDGDAYNSAGVRQADSEAIASQQRERLTRLGPPARQDAPAGTDAQRAQQRNEAREDWQDWADDQREPGYEYAGTAVAAAAVGAAVGAAAATPPYWTLPCTPVPVVVGATTYYQCGATWYVQAYSGGDVAYTIVNPPPGY